MSVNVTGETLDDLVSGRLSRSVPFTTVSGRSFATLRVSCKSFFLSSSPLDAGAAQFWVGNIGNLIGHPLIQLGMSLNKEPPARSSGTLQIYKHITFIINVSIVRNLKLYKKQVSNHTRHTRKKIYPQWLGFWRCWPSAIMREKTFKCFCSAKQLSYISRSLLYWRQDRGQLDQASRSRREALLHAQPPRWRCAWAQRKKCGSHIPIVFIMRWLFF